MDGYVTIGTELNTKEFDAQMRYIETKMLDIEDKLKQADMGFEVGDTEKLEAEYERLGNQLLGLKEKQEKYNQSIREAQMAGFNKIKESVDGVGNSLQKVTKRIAKMAVAVFGIRSAFMFVRNAINTIANGDEQLKADIDYMKNAIAYTLEPVVRGIVNLAKQLMFYVGYIVKAWTGKNIFENANKSLQKATGSAKTLNKELNKTVANFDEMNVLQDNTSSSSDSGSSTGPSFNLAAPEDFPVPTWLQWIADNKDTVLAVMGGVAAGLLAWKLGLSGIKALGIGIAITGIILAIQNLIKFLQDPTFDNFIGILKGIALAVLGVAIAIGAWPVAIGAAVALVVLFIVKHFDEIMGLFNKLIKWLDKNVLGGLKKLFGPLGNILYMPIKFFVTLAKTAFQSFFGGIKKVIEGVVKIFKGDFWGGIKTIFGGLLDIMLAPFKGLISGIWEAIKLIWSFLSEIGGKAGEILGGAFKTVINAILTAIENILNFPIRAINKLIDTINNIPGINIGRLNEFKLPRLAKGGIVNNPGPGVVMGSYVAGERGPEAVIPLDDQTLDRLGLAFARHTVINANITNTMNGRVISRELQKVQNDSDFAYNR